MGVAKFVSFLSLIHNVILKTDLDRLL
uniref:Uncharacterized protein n=1 Tax=Anguilla anguilla TaxID=7936 RepID=A0A0E9VFA8_ANGAN